ncbi:RNA polymerase sigma factor SigY [Paenibacillus pinihumi]|uniref:RNA polymerase sigma factor SigY n=1 Tax=Paenibacillus pinihumi TaxID=669462 RepID=UPI0004186FDE|nr:RNA polymerase sigma factor SigY [Paenibacillus pinihumi]
MDELELVMASQEGDRLALSMLLRNNYPFLVRYLMKITMHPQLAEDLTQETMMKAMEKIRLYNGSSKFSSWLITIGTNLYMDVLRKQKREQAWHQEEQALRKMKWQVESQGDEWPELLDALARINEGIRIPIIMKHYYGYSYDEIGRVMGIPSGTVKSRVSNGLKELRRELADDEQ